MNDDVIELQEMAQRVAIEAGAVAPCSFHENVLIDQGDPDAVKHAYALATAMLNAGEMACDRSDLMDAVSDIITRSAYGCPRCEATFVA